MEEIIILPGEYQQVEYIESHGEEYINTGIKANSNIKMEVTLINPDMSDDDDHTLCGGGVAWGEQYLQLQCRLNSMCSYGDNWDRVDFHGGNITTICQDKNNFYQDGELLSTFSSQQFNTNYDIHIFCAAQSNVPAEFSSFKVAGFKIYNDNNLVRDFIACVRVTDGEAGLYDLVTETFYTNEGSGAFTYPDTPVDSRLSQNLERIRQATNSIRSITGTDNDEIEVVAQAVSNLNDDNIAKDQEIAELEEEIERITPVGEIEITENGSINVAHYEYANVRVSGGGFTGHYDAEGLNTIGWSDEEIQYYQDKGVQWNSSEDSFFKLTADELAGDDSANTRFIPANSTKTNFWNYRKLLAIPLIDTSNVTNMSNRFNGCYSLTTIPQLNTSNATNMSSMFSNCYSLTTIPQLNTSKVTDMNTMFYYCYSLKTIPLLDTSNVTNMYNMFSYCCSLKIIPQLNTSNVTSMHSTFSGCYSLITIPLLDTSKVTMMYNMFNGCNSLTTIPLLNTSNVTSMNGMFNGCRLLTAIPLLDTSKVTDMSSMCWYCNSLTTIPQLDTSNVTNMSNMFNSCSSLTTIPLLDTRKVTSMYGMFYNGGNLLTDTSLDNILQMCINSLETQKTLVRLGFAANRYPASRIEALPHYQDFLDAGWTIGY